MTQLLTSPSEGRKRRQHDALPENVLYEDTGCEVNVSCLTCPLPQCRYDDPAWYLRYRRANRDRRIYAECARGLTVFEAAAVFGVSPRTVHRALQRVETPEAVPA